MRSRQSIMSSFLWISASSALCFALGSLFHFLYSWFPCLLFQILFPINESIWEHLKLCFYPVFFLWCLPLGKLPEQLGFPSPDLQGRITGIAFSSIVSMFITFFGFYGLKYGLELDGLLWNLLLYYFSLLVGQFHATRAAADIRISSHSQCWIYILIIIAVLFMLFSLAPLPLPAFLSPES